MAKHGLVAAATLWFALSGCGVPNPGVLISDGNVALGSGDPEAALEKFRAALPKLQPGTPIFVETNLCIVEALIPGDPKKAIAEFHQLSKEFPDLIGESQFVYIAGQLASSQNYDLALQLAYTGEKRLGSESIKIQRLIQRIMEEAVADAPVIERLSPIPCDFGAYADAPSR